MNRKAPALRVIGDLASSSHHPPLFSLGALSDFSTGSCLGSIPPRLLSLILLGDPDMTQTLFRCSNSQGHVIDGRVANVDDLIEAREYATRVARSLIAGPTLRDWRSVAEREGRPGRGTICDSTFIDHWKAALNLVCVHAH